MGLDRSVRKVPGILPIVAEAKEREKSEGVLCREENKAEAALVSEMQVIGVKDLKRND